MSVHIKLLKATHERKDRKIEYKIKLFFGTYTA